MKYVAGNVFEHIDVTNSQAHIGDTYHGDTASCEFFQNSNSAISEQLKSLQHLLSGTRSLINQQELRKHEDQLATVRDWISGIRVTRFHERAYQTHLESIGTGSWILEDDRLQHWLYEDLPRKPMLWMHGIPGAGGFSRYKHGVELTCDQGKQFLLLSSSRRASMFQIHRLFISTVSMTMTGRVLRSEYSKDFCLRPLTNVQI